MLLVGAFVLAGAAPKARPPLPPNRGAMITEKTRERRARLRAEFAAFVGPRSLATLTEDVGWPNLALKLFGRHLYEALRSKNDFAETILAIVDPKRSLGRRMTPAWDLVLQWSMLEPPEHRLAMPPVVLMAFVLLSLSWGWPVFASFIALAWTAFLRPGEFLAAERRHLHLPSDLLRDTKQAWLIIAQPQTRFLNARVQLARCD